MKKSGKSGNTAAAGFTLVELAIVMTIIGLLIGGVIKGEELLKNARVKRVMKDVESITAASTAFRDQYSQWPGDMANARQRLQNCDDDSFCNNGNADGKIGRFIFNPGGGVFINRLTANQANCGGPCRETVQYWKHLALADLITTVQPNADVAVPSYGGTHPPAPLARGYSVMHVQPTGGGTPTGGTFLRLEGIDLVNDVNAVSGAGRAVGVRPKEAQMLDAKMDDGSAFTGFVRGNGPQSCGAFDSPGFGDYDPTDTGASCLMYFRLH